MTQLLKEVIAARMADEERILNQVFSKNENKEKFEKNELEIPWRLHLCTNGSACVVRHVPEKRPTCVSSIPTPSHNPWRCTRVAQGPGSCPAGWQPQLLGLVGTQALGEMSNRASHWGCDEPPGRPAYGHLPLHSSQLPPS